jgi:hypothetical protein
MLRLFSVVYGERYCDSFKRVTLRSVSQQPLNGAAIADDGIWSIYTSAESAPRIIEILYHHKHVINIVDVRRRGSYDVMQRALVAEMEECFKTNSRMVMAPPDMFFGDGSIANLLALASARPDATCFSAPHVRVDHDKFMAALPLGTIDNPKLVQLALANLHCSWAQSDVTLDKRNNYYSGTSIQALPTLGYYAVTHVLPTCHLAQFTRDDLDAFKRYRSGAWDHQWPALLIGKNRHRVIGSSDIFFAVELTKSDENIPKLHAASEHPIDAYELTDRVGHEHNRINRNMIFVLREG